jgi:hypothetical protein
MRRSAGFIGCLVFGCAFIVFPCGLTAAERIAPTRTLQGEKEQPGKLAVFSEPPGLEVTLNGAGLGKTPLSLDGVMPGTHRLRVKNSETDITIEPGKTLQISLYKDKFILIPKTAKTPPQPPETVETNRTGSGPPPPPAQEQGPEELSPIERYRLLGHY